MVGLLVQSSGMKKLRAFYDTFCSAPPTLTGNFAYSEYIQEMADV